MRGSIPRLDSTVFAVLIAVLAGAGCLALAGCSASTTVDLTGTVVDDVATVQAPNLPAPMPDLGAGFRVRDVGVVGSGAAGRMRAGAPASAPATLLAITSLGSFVKVVAVRSSLGDTVRYGDLLATLDSQILDAQVAAARAASRVASAQVPVVDAAIDKLDSGQATIASGRRTLLGTVDQLRATRARLVSQLADLRTLLARIESIPAVPGGPGGGEPPTSTPGGVPPGSGLPTGGLPDPATVRAGMVRLQTAIAQIGAGLAKARAGLAQLSSASAKIDDAREQLRDIRRVVQIASRASEIGIDLARYHRSLTEIRSPVAGTVVSLARVGDVVAPGATIATVRRSGPSKVTAWLPPGDVPVVSVGDRAYVSSDSLGTRQTGRVTFLSDRAEYPPTWSATKQIHLNRAIPIEITLDSVESALAPGTPVDISIVPNSK